MIEPAAIELAVQRAIRRETAALLATAEEPEGYWSNLKEHHEIAAAIADRDPQRAREAVNVLLEKNRKDIEIVVEERLGESIEFKTK